MLINGAVGKGLYGMVPLSGVMPLRVSDCDRIMVYCRRESDESLASQITRTELPVTDSHEGDHLQGKSEWSMTCMGITYGHLWESTEKEDLMRNLDFTMEATDRWLGQKSTEFPINPNFPTPDIRFLPSFRTGNRF
ncbi:hypothetical protein CEXT_83061 [Caerostris extrusa]|uniref:Uncharacterized protein n=1 Tax=Caerostris extrusa TaxID=172846 RepID=A0AAV4SC41_CAEEX|nr:hypothetical protein CEXT_83061 [Caerostris extrusa]